MSAIPVFYSFHFKNDSMRAQQIRNIGALEGNEPVSANEWEAIRQKGNGAIQEWIDENMKWRRCVVVLIGSETYSRPWVHYEIKRAWELRKGLVGIHIHNVSCPRQGTCSRGQNPFQYVKNSQGQAISNYIATHDPWSSAYTEIRQNLESWVRNAVMAATTREP